MRGYKYILRITLKRKAAILLLNLYIKVILLQRAIKVINNPIKRDIKTVINNI